MIIDQRARSDHGARTRTGAPGPQVARRELSSVPHLLITEPTAQDEFDAASPPAGDDTARKAIRRTAAALTALGDGVRPDTGSFLDDFPYLGVPTSSEHSSS
jgi:hypothetical protein